MADAIKTNASAPANAAPVATYPISEASVLKLLEQVAELKAKVETMPAAPVSSSPTSADEIDWTKVTEESVADLNYYIPVIEHELPSYMETHLADDNYVARWVNRSPKRLGPLMAQGYEYVTPEHWDKNFPLILSFNGEGHLVMDDVVLLRVHKSRYFSALRRTHLKSTQLGNVMGLDKVRGQVNQMVANNPRLEAAIKNRGMSFIDGNVESSIEEISI